MQYDFDVDDEDDCVLLALIVTLSIINVRRFQVLSNKHIPHTRTRTRTRTISIDSRLVIQNTERFDSVHLIIQNLSTCWKEFIY